MEIEQLLEAFEEEERRGLRYACIWPADRFRGFVVRLHTVQDLEEPGGLPIDEFLPFYEADEDQDGARTIGEAESAEAALALAEAELRADGGGG
ncbi:hypothetical protein ACRYCC_39170 [Actinomadura scrupuli]|uniref:hypothetical protein n=1 Tax=Actinomadura scrupuli TaxID=559629 RepID=UPI003D97595F